MHRTLPVILATLSALTLANAAAAQAAILQGPVSFGGSRYYVIGADNWQTAQAFARSIGGELATIDSLPENQFIRTTFAAPQQREVFIGLSDAREQDAFEWSDGSFSSYANWDVNHPLPLAFEDFVAMTPTGRWRTLNPFATPFAIVEVTGPIRVPQEVATIRDALTILPQAGTTEIAVGPGTHPLEANFTPGSYTIRGASRDATTLVPVGTGLALNGSPTVPSSLRLESLKIRPTSPGSWINSSINGSLEINDADLDFRVLSTGRVFAALETGSFRLTLDHSTVLGDSAVFLRSDTAASTMTIRQSLITTRTFVTGNAVRATVAGSTIVNTGTGILAGLNHSVFLLNSILAGINTTPVAGITATHSIVPFVVPGPGNIVGDPGFVNRAAGDYRLSAASPAINAANSAIHYRFRPIVGLDARMNPRVVSTAIDMGGLEFTVRNTACPADLNADGVIDINDFFAYLAAFSAGCP